MTDLLEDARENIDEINREIADDVADRMEEVVKVVEYKEENDMNVKDEDREEHVMQQFGDLFEKRDLPRERGRQLGRLLIDTAIDAEREMMDK
jgi:chorismate mutase